MKGIFRWDSPVMQKLALVSNLICLNLLWIVCSLPIVTMGAATTALYYAVFQIQTNDEDAILRPFFRGFTQNFKQATLLWLPLLAATVLMLFNLRYLFAFGGHTIFWIVFIFMTIVVLLVQAQMLPMLARFEMTNKAIVKSSAALTLMHFLSCLIMTALNVVPIVAFFADVYTFMWLSPLWVCIWFAMIAYINGRILLKIWKKHMPDEQPEEIPEESAEED